MQLCRLCLFKHLWSKGICHLWEASCFVYIWSLWLPHYVHLGVPADQMGSERVGSTGGWEGYLRGWGAMATAKGVLRVIKPGKKMHACVWWRIPSHGQVSSRPWSRSAKFAQIRSITVNGCHLGQEKGHTNKEKSQSSGIKMQKKWAAWLTLALTAETKATTKPDKGSWGVQHSHLLRK